MIVDVFSVVSYCSERWCTNHWLLHDTGTTAGRERDVDIGQIPGGIFWEWDCFHRLHLMRTASQEKTTQNDIVLARSEQLGLVSWMRRVKRFEIYSQSEGSNP
jgi:hypothetical protein